MGSSRGKADHDVCNVLCTPLATVVVSVSCMQTNLTACQNCCCSSSCMLQIAELVLEVEFWVQLPSHAIAFLQLFSDMIHLMPDAAGQACARHC
jgi:hypothetical protein